MAERVPLGTHWLEFEPGPLLIVRFVGPFALPDSLRLAQLVDAHLGDSQRFFVLSDTLQAGNIPAEARRAHSRWLVRRPPLAVAMISTSFITSALGSLMHNAHRLMTGSDVPMFVCKTESAARAWLARQMAAASRGS